MSARVSLAYLEIELPFAARRFDPRSQRFRNEFTLAFTTNSPDSRLVSYIASTGFPMQFKPRRKAQCYHDEDLRQPASLKFLLGFQVRLPRI